MYMAQSRRPLLTNYASETGMELSDLSYLMQANGEERLAWIHEDRYGTPVHTQSELVGLDFLHRLSQAGMPGVMWIRSLWNQCMPSKLSIFTWMP